MRHFFYLLLTLSVTSCGDHKPATISGHSTTEHPKVDSSATDSILTFSFVMDFSHQNISNKSDRQIDLLFNGIGNYLGGQRNDAVQFRTECLPCEPVQAYLGGLLFAKQLLITPTQIKYFKNDFDIPDSLNRIKFNTDGRARKNPSFLFKEGKGSIKYIGISCNDADFNKVRLTYPTGEIVIDSLINASFFEYDLNKNGQKEQYLLGSRSCNQEFVLLRIRNPKD